MMESIADAVTHARFVGTETSSDEVVLVKILQVSHSGRRSRVVVVVGKGASSLALASNFC